MEIWKIGGFCVYKKSLDILQLFRALAAIMVVLYHATGDFSVKFNQSFINGVFDQGFSGVDFFFILSGFIIYYIHYVDIGDKTKFSLFISKRFVRIYPLHWIATTLMFVAFIFFGFGDGLVNSISTIISSYLLIPSQSYVNGVVWTLSHEILFYLMFSLLILFRRSVSYPIIIIWISITLLQYFGLVSFDSFLLEFIFSKYNIEFIGGSFIAYLVTNYQLNKRNLIFAFGLIFSLLSWYSLHAKIWQIDSVIAFGIPYSLIILGGASIAYRKTTKVPNTLKLEYFSAAEPLS